MQNHLSLPHEKQGMLSLVFGIETFCHNSAIKMTATSVE